jgi:MEDS: MEthanogen/methylotroph, DcmR Sensory domain
MSQVLAEAADLTFKHGDHVCAFYSNSGPSQEEIVASYVTEGLQEGDKCLCFVDNPDLVRRRIPERLLSQESAEALFRNPEDVYLTEGQFSKEAFIRRLDVLASSAIKDGYPCFRVLGDAAFIIRTAVDTKDWFGFEAEVNNFAPRYPQLLLCLYDLDQFGGDMILYVFKTHQRILVNGMVVNNPYYLSPDDFLRTL